MTPTPRTEAGRALDEQLTADAAETLRSGWMWAEASDIGAPTIEEARAEIDPHAYAAAILAIEAEARQQAIDAAIEAVEAALPDEVCRWTDESDICAVHSEMIFDFDDGNGGFVWKCEDYPAEKVAVLKALRGLQAESATPGAPESGAG